MTDAPPPPPMHVPAASDHPPVIPAQQGRGCAFYGCLTFALLLLTVVATVCITAWWIQRPVKAVILTEQEEEVLSNKVDYMTRANEIRIQSAEPSVDGMMENRLQLDDEDFVRKRVMFTEKELNAIVAKNSEFENNILITLRPNTILGATTITMPEFIPFVGGQNLRTKVKIFAELKGQKLDIRVQNISLGGIPLRNSWTGSIIGKNLVDLFADDDQMKALVDGIEEFEIRDGELVFMPAE